MFIRTTTEEAEKREQEQQKIIDSIKNSAKNDQHRHTAQRTSFNSYRPSRAAETGAFALVITLTILFSLIFLALSIWAITFGIMDINNNGVNTWAVIWIILGSIGILSIVFGRK